MGIWTYPPKNIRAVHFTYGTRSPPLYVRWLRARLWRQSEFTEVGARFISVEKKVYGSSTTRFTYFFALPRIPHWPLYDEWSRGDWIPWLISGRRFSWDDKNSLYSVLSHRDDGTCMTMRQLHDDTGQPLWRLLLSSSHCPTTCAYKERTWRNTSVHLIQYMVRATVATLSRTESGTQRRDTLQNIRLTETHDEDTAR